MFHATYELSNSSRWCPSVKNLLNEVGVGHGLASKSGVDIRQPGTIGAFPGVNKACNSGMPALAGACAVMYRCNCVSGQVRS